MKKLYRFLLRALNSWVSIVLVVVYCIASFYLGQRFNDINLFAASGAVVTVFGLFSMIRFTTIEKYLNQERIVAASTGVTGPPLSADDSKRLAKQNQEQARLRLQQELRSELKGISFTIVGTLIWAYGNYVPVFQWFSG